MKIDKYTVEMRIEVIKLTKETFMDFVDYLFNLKGGGLINANITSGNQTFDTRNNTGFNSLTIEYKSRRDGEVSINLQMGDYIVFTFKNDLIIEIRRFADEGTLHECHPKEARMSFVKDNEKWNDLT